MNVSAPVRNLMAKDLNRRRFLFRCGVSSAGAIIGLGIPNYTVAGTRKGVAEAFDSEMERFMSPRHVPGGAVAVVKDRRLVYARGYGWADRDKHEQVQPESLFRIASISKPFTATAILKLVEDGRLELESHVFDLLQLEPALAAGKQFDPRLKQVTVRQCLQHTGGWDRDQSGDPMFKSVAIARALNVPAPARQEAIIRYMLGQSLDFEPGQRYAYSNFGYCVLGRIVEKVSGRPYDRFVHDSILKPLGIQRMRLGASLEEKRAKGEVKYFTPDQAKAESVFPEHPGKVPAPYGSFCLEAMDSHGGWLASAVDLARFVAGLEGCGSPGSVLADRTRKVLYESPAAPVSRNSDGSLADFYYGCGWLVRPVGKSGAANYWHTGSLPGTFTLLVRRFDGLSWVALFNQRSSDPKRADGAIDPALHRAADAVAEWPAEDLFPRYAD